MEENENVKFNELEKRVYKIVCELGCKMIKHVLETQDKQIMLSRDKKEYRHKGYRNNTIKTVMGEIEYKRAIYVKDNKSVFLLDETISIDTIGKISSNLAEIMMKTVVNTTSYRKGAKEIQNTTNETISHQALNKLVWQVGKMIEEKENQEVKLYKQEKLVKGTKQINALFEEADGIWFNLQGKDRKESVEKYRKQCEKKNKEFNLHHKHKTELKLLVMYEGWEKDDKRHPLVNKSYIAGMISIEKLKKLRNARVYQKYDESNIKLRASNGDGARWINNLATKDTIRQKDLFHIRQEIIRDIKEEQYREPLIELLKEKRYAKVPIYIDNLKKELGGEEKVVKKLDTLKSYLKDGLPRYQDILKEQKREMPEPPAGLEYRDMGTMESQIFTVLKVRLCSGRKAFLKLGASYLSKICAEYYENNGEIEIEKIENDIPIDDFVENWIKEIEENVRRNKKIHRVNLKETEEDTYARGTVIGITPELQELLKLAEPTALIYR